MEMLSEVIQEKKQELSVFDRTRAIMRSETSIEKFADALGNERIARSFVASVLLAVGNNKDLQECTPESIMISAMRSATLKLNVDPGVGHAYMVPFNNKDGKKATLIVGYKGLIQMAQRTGKYRYLNVAAIWDGQEIEEDQYTGMHKISGTKAGHKAKEIGYMLYFKLFSGYEKTFYMSVEEIIDHAKKYSKTFGKPGSFWEKNFDDMARKTVLRKGLTRWGIFETVDAMLLGLDEGNPEEIDAVLSDGDVVSAEWMDQAVEEEIKFQEEQKENPKPTEMLINSLGFDDPNEAPKKDADKKKKEAEQKQLDWASKFQSKKFDSSYGRMTIEQLQAELMALTAYEPKTDNEITVRGDKMQAAKLLIKYLQDQEKSEVL